MAETPGIPSEISSLLSALERVSSAAEGTTQAIKDKQAAEEAAKKAAEERAEQDEKTAEASTNVKKEFSKLENSAKAVVTQLANMATAGIKFGTTIGTSATKGVELELKNRAALISQIGKVELDRMVNMEQLKAAQTSLTDTFISTRAGMEISSDATRRFTSDLSAGFKSNFQLTGESLKALTVIGATTTGQMDSFRQATGRASLSSGQLATIVNKNTTSFLLFGNKFAKAAADAERAGISLAAIQGAQEGMVSSLDNVVDVTNQLNQLGAQIDFGTLVQRLEQEGPDAVIKYLSSTVPGDLFQSTSFRALFNQLGINSEQILRQQQVGSAADQIESQMTKTATAASTTTKGFTLLGRATEVLQGSFGGVALAAAAATISLFKLSAAGALAGTPGRLGSIVSGAGATAGMRGGGAVTGVAGGTALGMAAGGSMKASLVGSLAGTLGSVVMGRMIGGTIGTFIGGPLGTAIGGMLGGYIAGKLFKADDMLSGYGNRTLLTPGGAYALNNRDTVIAGTNLFKGDDVMSFGQGVLSLMNPAAALGGALGTKLGSTGGTSPQLEKKIDDLISILRSGPRELVVNVEGTKKSTGMRVIGVTTTRAES